MTTITLLAIGRQLYAVTVDELGAMTIEAIN